MIWRITAEVRVANTTRWLPVAEMHDTEQSFGVAMQRYLAKFVANDAKNLGFARYSHITGEQDGHAGCVFVSDAEEK